MTENANDAFKGFFNFEASRSWWKRITLEEKRYFKQMHEEVCLNRRLVFAADTRTTDLSELTDEQINSIYRFKGKYPSPDYYNVECEDNEKEEYYIEEDSQENEDKYNPHLNIEDGPLECGYSREFLKRVSKDGFIDYIDLQLMGSMIAPDGRSRLDEFIEELYPKE